MVVLKVISLLGLIAVFYQDMKYRAVYWIFFPLLALLFFLIKYPESGWMVVLEDAFWAIAFFAFQLLLLWGYFRIKKGKNIQLIDHYLGLGDILFLGTVAFYFSPVNYVLFYLSSLLIVLLYVMIKGMFNRYTTPHIPLAGLQAIFLFGLMVWEFCNGQIQLGNDSWIYHSNLWTIN